MNQLTVGATAPATSNTTMLIPDSDGQYGRGFRDCLEAFKLAAAGQSIPICQVDAIVSTLHDAYGNNADTAVAEEISETLVVSTWHLHPSEVAALETEAPWAFADSMLIRSMAGEYGWLVHIPSEDALECTLEEWLAAEKRVLSAGLFGVLKRAVQLGVQHIRFDRDADALESVVGYDHSGNPENWSL